MRIRAIKQLCGPHGSTPIGEEFDAPDGVAVAWIRDGAAEPAGPVVIETATAEPKTETAERKPRRSK